VRCFLLPDHFVADAPIGEKVFNLLFLLASLSGEQGYNQKLAHCLGGQVETRLAYPKGFVRVDIETKTHLIEAGLDKRSSLDSLQQVVFFHHLKPHKLPMIIIYDSDGIEGKIEHQLRTTSQKFGIAFYRVSTRKLNRGICPNLKK
jgi:hypothetical protein